MTTPTFGSLFAGVGGFDLGFEAAGFECKFQVEWDEHCQQVLAHHWPNVPRWGDVSEVSGYDMPPVDVITYGFPCQDLSVAGKRAGLDGDRSNLFFEAVRIIREMKEATHGLYPKFAVAENVTGLLTADGGNAMSRVLDTLAQAGSVGIEWCTLDAQWFGVPQRRRRVFIAACFDSATFAHCPDPLFPVAEGGARNPAEVAQEGQKVTGTVEEGAGSVSTPIAFSHTQGLDIQPSETAFPTLRAGGGGHAVAQPVSNGTLLRRLTPLECERLMGWPDDHTLHRADGNTNSDTTRYKMCGNGVVAPVAQWIAKHIYTPLDSTGGQS